MTNDFRIAVPIHLQSIWTLKRHVAAINKITLNRVSLIRDQFYEVQLVKPEIEHLKNQLKWVSSTHFTLSWECRIFKKKFDTNFSKTIKYELLEMDTGLPQWETAEKFLGWYAKRENSRREIVT